MLPFLTADGQSCGRVDVSSLSDQTLLELLVSDMHHVDKVQDADGDFLDIAEWKGVEVADAGVTQIEFRQTDSLFAVDEDFTVGPKGSIDLQWLPKTLQVFNIDEMELHGTIETSALPCAMRYLNISDNAFQGTFCTKGLPETIEFVLISCNELHGSISLDHLPRNIELFCAQSNNFSGELNFLKLPESLNALYLYKNKFRGKIDLSRIPARLRSLNIRRNQITQETLVIAVSAQGIPRISLDEDKFGNIINTDGENISGLCFE